MSFGAFSGYGRFGGVEAGTRSGMKDRELLRAAIAEALSAVRRGDEQDALLMFDRLAGSSWNTLQDTVLELADANYEMLLTMTGSRRDDDLVITLCDEDGSDRTVDDLEPAQRTATRVLLALAAGRPEDARTQLEIAGAADEPAATGQVLAHTVGWTLEMVETCEDAGRPVPRWLYPVLIADR
ncbi:MAG TPA: hypothetical protein VHV74_25685 [Pseudonocardiaceae bacterium]|nr:hypothetical protein [Pseudonocardiaceae bacterium]